jgi:hypothetical protein
MTTLHNRTLKQSYEAEKNESGMKQAQEMFDTICVWLQEYNIDERLWLEELITECRDMRGTANKDFQKFLPRNMPAAMRARLEKRPLET